MAAKRKAGASKLKSARAKSSKRAKQPAKSRPAAKPRPKLAARGKITARPRTKSNGAMFQKVAFTLFSVSDPTRARNFYENVLGLERGLASPDGVWTEYDLPGGGCLALFRHPDPNAAKAPGGSASIAFEVADLDALNQRLAAEGVVYQGDVVHGPNCRMSNILDSEGNAIILHELAHAK